MASVVGGHLVGPDLEADERIGSERRRFRAAFGRVTRSSPLLGLVIAFRRNRWPHSLGIRSHRHCTPVQVSRGGGACQFGRASAPMIPQLVHNIAARTSAPALSYTWEMTSEILRNLRAPGGDLIPRLFWSCTAAQRRCEHASHGGRGDQSAMIVWTAPRSV
jgi:hypothetical protein